MGELSHVEINVADLDAARQFWGWLLPLLGYHEFQAWPDGFSFLRGRTYLVFARTAAAYRDDPFHRGRNGINHIAFHADSAEQVDWLTALLKERGVPLLYENRYPYAAGLENYAVFFEAPDRLKVEVVYSATMIASED